MPKPEKIYMVKSRCNGFDEMELIAIYKFKKDTETDLRADGYKYRKEYDYWYHPGGEDGNKILVIARELRTTCSKRSQRA